MKSKLTIKVGDNVRCRVGNMGQIVEGVVVSIRPAFANFPEKLNIEGRIINWMNTPWHGECYADEIFHGTGKGN